MADTSSPTSYDNAAVRLASALGDLEAVAAKAGKTLTANVQNAVETDGLRTQITHLEEEADRANAEVETLKTALALLREEHAQDARAYGILKADHQALKRTHGETVKRLDHAIARLEQILSQEEAADGSAHTQGQ